jgi:hypothetical protein
MEISITLDSVDVPVPVASVPGKPGQGCLALSPGDEHS